MAQTPINQEAVRGHCPKCGPETSADVIAHHAKHIDAGEGWVQLDYHILGCRGCGAVYYMTEERDSNDETVQTDPETGERELYIPVQVTYWPPPLTRPEPEWISDLFFNDPALYKLVGQTYGALNAGFDVLCATGMRTTFDRASELLGVDPEISFAAKLRALEDRGKIGTDERASLDALTDAGSAAAHRGWRPSAAQLSTMMTILEQFLHRSFILNEAARALKKAVPPRPER